MSLFSYALLYFRIICAISYGTFAILTGTRVLPKLQIQKVNLSGKNAIVTGANSGIGYEASRQLAEMGATVYLACRSIEKGEKAADLIRSSTGNKQVHVLELDTASLDSVRSFAASWAEKGQPIHIVLHNAGIASTPKNLPFTADGFETIYQTNFLSSFLLTHLLERHLFPSAHIVFTSSHGAFAGGIRSNFSLSRRQNTIEPGFHTGNRPVGSSMYANSKLMQIAFARALQRRFRHQAGQGLSQRCANAFAPGLVETAIFGQEKFTREPWWKDPAFAMLYSIIGRAIPVEQGTMTGVFLATSGEKRVVETQAGGYWDRLNRWMSPADALSDVTIDRLWIRWCADAGIEWL